MIAYLVIIALSMTTLTCLFLFLRARKLLREFTLNQKALEGWLRVHHDLQNASNAVIEVKRVDTDAIFYREPVR